MRIAYTLQVVILASTVYEIVAELSSQENTVRVAKRYKPTWEDLDTRPLPAWYDEAKLGIFIHWGVFSVPSYKCQEWLWNCWMGNDSDVVNFMRKNYPPGFTYQDFAPQFTAEFFDADQWADLFLKSGAKYVVLTTKHHDGFALFPSKRSFGWNSVDVGPKRDVVGELSRAVRAKGLRFGTYHSLFEWYNPIYIQDKESGYRTRNYVETKLLPDLKQVVEDYQPSIFWADGDANIRDTYWNSSSVLAWLYNDSPVGEEIVVNDRWGNNVECKHGDIWTCNDGFNPGTVLTHKWENCFRVGPDWGYRRTTNIQDYKTMPQLLREIVTTVSCGGNALANISPTQEGTITPIFQERLLQLGEWLKINGEAIFKTSPWHHQNDTINGRDVWYTCTKSRYNEQNPTAKPEDTDDITAIYAIVLGWPKNNILNLRDISRYLNDQSSILLMGNRGALQWTETGNDTTIRFPDVATVRSKYAYVLKITDTVTTSISQRKERS